jgi:hypothetical protein
MVGWSRSTIVAHGAYLSCHARNNALSLGEIDNLGQTELVERPVIKLEDSDERTGL